MSGSKACSFLVSPWSLPTELALSGGGSPWPSFLSPHRNLKSILGEGPLAVAALGGGGDVCVCTRVERVCVKIPPTELLSPERRGPWAAGWGRSYPAVIQEGTSSESGMILQETRSPLGHSSVTHQFCGPVTAIQTN